MKKIQLFILLQIIWACLLVGSLWVYHNYFQLARSLPITITIITGDPKNGTLELLPDANSTVIVKKNQMVIWKIDSASNVDSFRIEKKDTSAEIFDQKPHKKQSKEDSGKVKSTKLQIVYDYNIFWKIKGDKADSDERKFDPKLAINPSIIDPLEYVIYFSYGALFLLSFVVLRNAKKTPYER